MEAHSSSAQCNGGWWWWCWAGGHPDLRVLDTLRVVDLVDAPLLSVRRTHDGVFLAAEDLGREGVHLLERALGARAVRGICAF